MLNIKPVRKFRIYKKYMHYNERKTNLKQTNKGCMVYEYHYASSDAYTAKPKCMWAKPLRLGYINYYFR